MNWIIGWGSGLIMAFAIVYTFKIENVIIAVLLGFSLSMIGIIIVEIVDA